jgi:hypothetical protein
MAKNNVIDYTIDAKVAISIFLLTEQADGTSKQETIRRNIEVDDMKDMDELKTYIKMFIEAVEKGLKEELK